MSRAENILERVAVAIASPAPQRIGASLDPSLAKQKQDARHAKKVFKAGRKVHRLQKRLDRAQGRQAKIAGGAA